MSDAQTITTADIPRDGDGRLFSPKIVLGMILAGVFAFSAFVVLSTYAPDLQSGDNGQAHALSKSAVGYGGMVRLLRGLDEPVVVSRRDLSRDQPALIIFTPGPNVSRDAYIKAAQLSSRTLVVLPKWRGGLDPKHPGWVSDLKPIAPRDQTDLLKAIGTPKATTAIAKGAGPRRLVGAPGSLAEGMSVDTGPIRDLQSVSGPGLVPVLTDAQGRIVLARRMPTETYILADPDLINTMGLKDIRTARAGVGILRTLRDDGAVGRAYRQDVGRTIAFDVTLNGFARSRSVLKLAFEAPFVGATLCLVAAALLMGLHAAARFRAVRRGERALALGKDALIDNSAGLIRMAKREPALAPRYAELQRAAATKALGGARAGGSRLEGQALTDFLDRQGERFGAADSASNLDEETRTVRSLGDLMKVAAKWHQWRLEMTRERR
ncbi:hypothetical protein ASD21_17925 [Caulobacter sp. Root1455]|uniref:hypothetical protein n=1 Tax=Caulobacter sp. Root1455 TaxID=1736465 RepID=UPI0006F34A9A|nr:hypothetical protein [Caulobacter sp. Root1455]KQZ05868.1 hypothetical protein ASD21_17925 [Caulobacter sp. Root1455]